MNLKAVAAAIESPKTPENLKKGLIRKYGKRLGSYGRPVNELGVYDKVKFPKRKKKNPLDLGVMLQTGAGVAAGMIMGEYGKRKLLKENPKNKISLIDQKYEDKLEVLFDKYVPKSGQANTIEGEMIRAIMRIMYRYFNDGDYYFRGYGKETVSPSVDWLIKHSPLGKELKSIFSAARKMSLRSDSPDQYSETRDGYLIALRKAVRVIVDYVKNRKQFDMNFTKDSRSENPGAAWHQKRMDEELEAYKKFGSSRSAYDQGRADGRYEAHDHSYRASTSKNNPAMDIYLGVLKSNESRGTVFATKTKPTAALYPQYVRVYGPFSHVKHVLDFAKSKGIDCNGKENPVHEFSEQDYEYRYWVEDIDQGHYETDFRNAYRGAVKLSKDFPKKFISLDLFRPFKLHIMRFFDGRAYSFSSHQVARTIMNQHKHDLSIGNKSNPPHKGVKIYDNIEAIEAQKGSQSLWPREKFRHDFKKNSSAVVLGMPDGSLQIKSKTGKRLWKNFDYSERSRR